MSADTAWVKLASEIAPDALLDVLNVMFVLMNHFMPEASTNDCPPVEAGRDRFGLSPMAAALRREPDSDIETAAQDADDVQIVAIAMARQPHFRE